MIHIKLTEKEKKDRRRKQAREAVARYYDRNKNDILKKQKERKYAIKRRELAIMLLGGKCVRCNMNDIRCLQIDHINGGGTRERKIKSEARKLKHIIENTSDAKMYYQVLCANCNWIKRYENGECDRE